MSVCVIFLLQDLHAIKLIEAFIQEALELHKEQQKTKVDFSRYLYIPVLSGVGVGMVSGGVAEGYSPQSGSVTFRVTFSVKFSVREAWMSVEKCGPSGHTST